MSDQISLLFDQAADELGVERDPEPPAPMPPTVGRSPEPPTPSRAEQAERAFQLFHAANPDVYAELVAMAREGKAAGRTRLGIKQLLEVVRWHRSLVTTGDAYKINNNHAPKYARLIMANEPDLAGIFELRASPGESSDD